MLNKRWNLTCGPFASKAVFWAILKDFVKGELKILQNLLKNALETKGRRYTTGKVQNLFDIDLYTYLAIYIVIGEANGKSSTFTLYDKKIGYTQIV